MTNTQTARLSIALLSTLIAASVGACTSADPAAAQGRAILIDDAPQCSADEECPAGFACEDQTDGVGVQTSFCQAEGSDVGCPAGYELEVEHGQTFCKADGGGSDGSTGTAAGGDVCGTDADCAPGLECDTEWLGHGASASTCEVHGGDGGHDGSDDGSDTGSDDHGSDAGSDT